MRRSLLLLVALPVFGNISAHGQSKVLAGAYQSCEMACQTIQIRPDHTFERVLDGDLFNDERTVGKWISLGGNRIRAIGPKPSGPPKVKETPAVRNNFQVVVTDFVGAVLPQVELVGIADGKTFRCLTNDDGYCETPICKSFTVIRQHYTGTYNVNSPSSRTFRVELSYEQMPNSIIDDIWVIERGILYWEKDGKIDKDYGLHKISRKKELKIFPQPKR
jgi:hypothetical protein